MNPHRATRPRETGGNGKSRRRQPRVVILDEGRSARVEILELPDTADVGTSFCHSGTSWRVIGERPQSRVFIAQPEN